MRRIHHLFILLIIASVTGASCKKEWLDAKPALSLVLPSTVKDYQALLDNTNMNLNDPQVSAISADEFEAPLELWQSVYTPQEKNAYIWAKEMWEGTTAFDYNSCYSKIYTANAALEGLAKIDSTPANALAWSNAKGSACFFVPTISISWRRCL